MIEQRELTLTIDSKFDEFLTRLAETAGVAKLDLAQVVIAGWVDHWAHVVAVESDNNGHSVTPHAMQEALGRSLGDWHELDPDSSESQASSAEILEDLEDYLAAVAVSAKNNPTRSLAEVRKRFGLDD